MKSIQRIILDTNALMNIAEFNIDLTAAIQEAYNFPFKITILQATLDELEKIKREQRLKFKRAAELALKIITAKKIEIISEEGYVDDLLVQHSKSGDLILTQDINLKKRLQKPYFTIRQKKKIILVL